MAVTLAVLLDCAFNRHVRCKWVQAIAECARMAQQQQRQVLSAAFVEATAPGHRHRHAHPPTRSQEKDGVKYMLPRDLVRAIVPTFPPHGSQVERAGYLDGALWRGADGGKPVSGLHVVVRLICYAQGQARRVPGRCVVMEKPVSRLHVVVRFVKCVEGQARRLPGIVHCGVMLMIERGRSLLVAGS